MSEERLLNLLGVVNDDYIVEANPQAENKKKRGWIKWCAMAASLCLIVSGVALGQRVVDCLDIKNKCYTDALDEILHNDIFCSYLDDEADLTFAIVSDKEDAIKAGITDCTQKAEYDYSDDNWQGHHSEHHH